ncbi:Uncharacterised protein [Actinomyces slackii]|uniref:DUF7926 domain-containing protein n=4 Tax=Actinomyces slackii TaxID=52774 RepID=A0A448KDS6_9ACTO|nr:Uncharacterised protein [Actinomyces slackii]
MQFQYPAAHRRYAAAALSAVLLILGGLIALTVPSAHAAQNSAVKVSFEPLVLADHSGNEYPGKPAHLEDPVRLKFTWDASAANPQPGESFIIALPDEYRFREIGRQDDLVLSDGTKVGDCVTEAAALTCTFNTAISAATELKGSGNQLLVAQQVTQTSTTTFNANGTDVTVSHPNDEPILPIAWEEKDLGKYANSLNRESSSATWHIQFSGTTIANHLGVADGSVSSVTLKDTTGGGQVLNPDKSTWYVRVNPQRFGGGADGYFDVAKADGTQMTTEHGTFTLTPTISEDGTSATVTLTRTDGTFDPDTNYEIVYQSLAEGGRIVPGKVYTNSATLEGGAGTTVSTQVSYKDPISYDVQLTQGFGSFGVKKYVTGERQGDVTSETKVRVTVAYELPNGTTEADYRNWTNKPATNPYTVEVAVNEKQPDNTLYEFPKGTRITLTEDTSAATLPDSLAWGETTFSVNDSQSPDTASFTVAEEVTPVSLYNEVTTETPQPTPDPTPTQDPTDPTPTQDPTEPTPTQDPTDPAPTQDPTDPAPSQDPTDPAPTESPVGPTPTGDPTGPKASTTTVPVPTGGTGALASTGAAVVMAVILGASALVAGAILMAARRRSE